MTCKLVVIVYLSIAFYFVASISLTVFNKWFFAEKQTASTPASGITPGDTFSTHQFHFPLTVTCLHQFLVFILVLATESNFLRSCVGEVVRSRNAAIMIVPIGLASGLDWGLSNTSMRWIPLSMYEMVKCSSPMFVLVIGWWIGVQPMSWKLFTLIGILSVGVFLSITGGEISSMQRNDFPMHGFICVCVATMLAAVRVVLAQKVLHGEGDREPINTATFLFYATPTSSLILVLPAFIFEGPQVWQYFSSHTPSQNAWIVVLVCFSSGIAYFLSLSEYTLTKNTSGLTLCVAGIAKQVVITAIAMVLFHEKLGKWNVIGTCISLIGIGLYNYVKYRDMTSTQSADCFRAVSTDGAEEEGEEMTHARKSEKYSLR